MTAREGHIIKALAELVHASHDMEAKEPQDPDGPGSRDAWRALALSARGEYDRTHARLAAAERALDGAREALRALEATVSKSGESSEWLDREGMRFYRETRIWPPFKSAPLEMHHALDDDERQRRWREWATAQRDAAIDRARATLRGDDAPTRDALSPTCPKCGGPADFATRAGDLWLVCRDATPGRSCRYEGTAARAPEATPARLTPADVLAALHPPIPPGCCVTCGLEAELHGQHPLACRLFRAAAHPETPAPADAGKETT